jgi:ABC-2 type transport system ATP-binding protein
VLDEPWEGLDPDAARWLSTAIETKRDRGAIIIVSSHRLYDLAGLCDAYLFLAHHRAALVHAHDISSTGMVTAADLIEVFDRLQGATGSRVWWPSPHVRHAAEGRQSIVDSAPGRKH